MKNVQFISSDQPPKIIQIANKKYNNFTLVKV